MNGFQTEIKVNIEPRHIGKKEGKEKYGKSSFQVRMGLQLGIFQKIDYSQ